MQYRNIALLIGTRPEAIKLMPVILALKQAGRSPKVFVTGQHRELLTQTLSDLNITITENLNLMKENQPLPELSASILTGMESVLDRHETGVLIVQGDTTSVAIGALACFYADVKVAHVEAGLRTHCRRNPFPEEMNRKLAACLADIHFAPTVQAKENLLMEGIEAERIHVVGNTVVDALFHVRERAAGKTDQDPEIRDILRRGKKIVLVTAHRRESFGSDLASMCEGISLVAKAFPDQIEVVFPVHMNPNVRSVVMPALSSIPNIHLVEPLSYLRFIEIMMNSKLIITDSGGVQEEAATLGVPVLVTRRTCERLEAVDAGISQLVGPDARKIFESARALLSDESAYGERAKPAAVFGDGHAAERIVKILLEKDWQAIGK